jgi:hypothetical protein
MNELRISCSTEMGVMLAAAVVSDISDSLGVAAGYDVVL